MKDFYNSKISITNDKYFSNFLRRFILDHFYLSLLSFIILVIFISIIIYIFFLIDSEKFDSEIQNTINKTNLEIKSYYKYFNLILNINTYCIE